MPLGPNVVQFPTPPCDGCGRRDGVLTFEGERKARVYLCLDCALADKRVCAIVSEGQ